MPTRTEDIIRAAIAQFTAAAPPMTCPNDTAAYTAGDLVANDTNGSNVTVANGGILAFDLPVPEGSLVLISKAVIKKNQANITTAQFRLHLFTTLPTIAAGAANGDNAVFAAKVTGLAGESESLDITMRRAYADPGAMGVGLPTDGNDILIDLPTGSKRVYGLLEALTAYARSAGQEQITVALRGHRLAQLG